MTLAEIQDAVLKEANGLPITRHNYAILADRVIAHEGMPLTHVRLLDLKLREWDVYQQAMQLKTNDWLDLACHRAAANQVRQAAARLGV
jgi:7-keto-8-aminopelargonate synthetase-like enzyme